MQISELVVDKMTEPTMVDVAPKGDLAFAQVQFLLVAKLLRNFINTNVHLSVCPLGLGGNVISRSLIKIEV